MYAVAKRLFSTAASQTPVPSHGVDLCRYPIDQLSAPAGVSLVESCRKRLKEEGIVYLPGFLTDAAIRQCASEAQAKGPAAFETDGTHNAFLLPDADPTFPSDHARNRLMPTRVASVAYDELAPDGQLRSFYEWKGLAAFLGAVLERTPLFRLDDPIGACSVNVFRPGWHHSYHFDESEFSTTLCLQSAEKGGLFQYSPPMRRSKDDVVYDQVASYLDGKAQPLTLPFEPGTLSIFSGSSCLHRVTEAQGSRDRLVAVLCWASKAGVKNSPEIQKLFWGRAA